MSEVSLESEMEEMQESLVKSLKSLHSAILDLPPSCVEFYPEAPSYFVIGTYNLEKGRADGEREEAHRERKGADGEGKSAVGKIGEKEDAICEKEAATDNRERVIDNKEGTINKNGTSDDSKGSDEKGTHPAPKENSQLRNGSLMLYQILDNSILKLHQTVTYPSAVLDLHFSPHRKNYFLVASSTASVSLYNVLEVESQYRIRHVQTYELFPESTLVLSLAWHFSFPGIIGVTLSSGTVALLQLDSSFSTLSIIRDDLNPHSGPYGTLEAWTLAFSPSHYSRQKVVPQGIYSGGDDSRLRCVTFTTIASLRSSSTSLSFAAPGGLGGMIGHNAGVTAILPLPLDTKSGQDILITGSYDDHVRVFATYDYRPDQPHTKPKPLAELYIGGGVWRLKFLREYALHIHPGSTSAAEGSYTEEPKQTFRVLASCMHAGARILEIRGSKHGEWTIKILAKFEEHKSMNYASDVQLIHHSQGLEARLDDRSALCVSTSFYDRLLCVWRYEE